MPTTTEVIETIASDAIPRQPGQRSMWDLKGIPIFIATDAFSKWIVVFPVLSPSVQCTIACMRVMFTNQGLPDMAVLNNGPAFASEVYKTFLEKNGMKRMPVRPYHPASMVLWRGL